VAANGDYYVFVKLIEVNAKRGDGKSWDTGGSAPDLYFNLFWNGTKIYTSPQRNDRLIAEWDLFSVNVKDAILQGTIDIPSALNAPLVRAEPGGKLTIEVWDDDTTMSDLAGRYDYSMAMLHPGLNKLEPQGGAVNRIVLDLIPRDVKTTDLIERASNR
jgi:hypothetical protein